MTNVEELRSRLNELLATEVSRRRETVREERFHNLALAELFLVESERFQRPCPARSLELAWLAQAIADQPYPGDTVACVDRILARSFCLQGNAQRLLGNRHEAELCFQRATPALTGPPGAVERGFYCQMLAYLREEQGHVDEASALLWRAAGIYREARATVEQGACLCRLALLHFYEDDLEQAGRLFAQARGLLSFACSPALAARCSLGLAICRAALGETDQARCLRQESRPLGDGALDAGDWLELDWLEGRLAVLLGEPEEAVARLSSVRRRLFEQRRLSDAALCSLDLARTFVQTGQEARAQRLIDELHAAFPASLDQMRMLVALHDFVQSARQGADLDGAAREAVELIRRPSAILKKL